MSATLTHLSQQQHNACAKSLCSIIHLSVCRHCVQALCAGIVHSLVISGQTQLLCKLALSIWARSLPITCLLTDCLCDKYEL